MKNLRDESAGFGKVLCHGAALMLTVFFAVHGPVLADDISVGAILQLGGATNQYGVWVARGVEIARDEINARGGVRGKKLKIVFEASENKAARAVTAFRKLMEVDRVAALLTNGSPVAMAIGPLANQRKIVQMELAAVTEHFRTPHDYTFRIAVSAAPLAKRLARYLIEKRLTAAGVLTVADDYGESMAEFFGKDFAARGGRVAASETFLNEDTDFKPQLMRMRGSRVRALVVAGRFEPMMGILKQAREVGLTVPIVSDHYSIESEQVLKVAGANAEGVAYAAPFMDRTRPAAAAFIARYRERYGEEPVQMAAQGHDGLLALAAAMEACTPITSDCVRLTLEKLSLEGVLGRLEFDEMGDAKGLGTVMKRVRGGKFESAP